MKNRYYAFVDPASGGARDRMTLAICHVENGIAILDVIRKEKPPFRPSEVIADFCKVLKAYGCSQVTGDRFASGFAAEAFEKYGIIYEVSPRSKSDLFRDLLPLIHSGKCELLEHEGLLTELQALERRTSRGGRDQIAGPPSGFDDIANAVAGALTLPGKAPTEPFYISQNDPVPPEMQAAIEEEEEKVRQLRREIQERESDGSNIFQDSLSAKKKLF